MAHGPVLFAGLMATTSDTETGLAFGEQRGRWVLAATVLGSGMAFVDATVVNVALPRIGESLDAGLAGLQWTINGYTLTLASLILLGGSLGDRFGRRRVFVIGVTWFAVASLLCGIAPNIETLVAARALQGIGGALLTPGSLAILQSSFRPEDRARAIGAWSGLGGVAGAAGPFIGGYLVQAVSWRLIFLINLPLAIAVVVITVRHVPESRDPQASRHIDALGALLGAVGLGAFTYGLIAWQGKGLGSAAVGRGRAVRPGAVHGQDDAHADREGWRSDGRDVAAQIEPAAAVRPAGHPAGRHVDRRAEGARRPSVGQRPGRPRPTGLAVETVTVTVTVTVG